MIATPTHLQPPSPPCVWGWSKQPRIGSMWNGHEELCNWNRNLRHKRRRAEEMIFFFRRRRDQKLDWLVHVSKKAPGMLPPTIILSNIMPNSWKAWMDMNHAYQLVQAESASCRGRASECNPWASDPHLASTAPSSGLCSRRSREFSPCLLADRWMLYLPTLTRDKNLHPTALSWFTTLHNHRLRNSSSPTHKH